MKFLSALTSVKAFSTIGSYASLVGLLLVIRPPDKPLNFWHWMFLGIGTILFIIALVSQVRDVLKDKTILLSTQKQIRDYMYQWISRAGVAAIFTRDMSWVQDEEMRTLLRSKARRDELCLCLPQRIALSDELEKEGARVSIYPELNYTPQSRFTLINKGRMDAEVAVGRGFKDKHLIEEFSVGGHPAFFIADDLIEIISRFNEWKNSAGDRL